MQPEWIVCEKGEREWEWKNEKITTQNELTKFSGQTSIKEYDKFGVICYAMLLSEQRI